MRLTPNLEGTATNRKRVGARFHATATPMASTATAMNFVRTIMARGIGSTPRAAVSRASSARASH